MSIAIFDWVFNYCWKLNFISMVFTCKYVSDLDEQIIGLMKILVSCGPVIFL